MKKFNGYFQAFIDYTPTELKKSYVQKFIISVWDRPLKDGRLIFGRDFRVDGKYSVRSFDAFFCYLIERLDDLFFQRCDQLVSDLEESLHEIFICYKASKQSLLQTTVTHHQNQQQLNEQARNYLHLYIHGYKLCDIPEYRQKVAWAFL